MFDFTLDVYEFLLNSFRESGYDFCTLENYFTNIHEKLVVVMHDVDKRPFKALQMGTLEKQLQIKSSYYFRTVDQVYDESIICIMARFGHEVSYLYENLPLSCINNLAKIR